MRVQEYDDTQLIIDLENRMSDLVRVMGKKRQDLDNLYAFQQKHRESIFDISNHFGMRIQKIKDANLNVNSVHIYAKYQENMQQELLKHNQYLQMREAEQDEISRQIVAVETAIDDLRKQMLNLEQQLSDVYYQQRLERERTYE